MTATLEEIVHMLVEERAQRETDMSMQMRKRSSSTNDNYAAAYGITLASSE